MKLCINKVEFAKCKLLNNFSSLGVSVDVNDTRSVVDDDIYDITMNDMFVYADKCLNIVMIHLPSLYFGSAQMIFSVRDLKDTVERLQKYNLARKFIIGDYTVIVDEVAVNKRLLILKDDSLVVGYYFYNSDSVIDAWGTNDYIIFDMLIMSTDVQSCWRRYILLDLRNFRRVYVQGVGDTDCLF